MGSETCLLRASSSKRSAGKPTPHCDALSCASNQLIRAQSIRWWSTTVERLMVPYQRQGAHSRGDSRRPHRQNFLDARRQAGRAEKEAGYAVHRSSTVHGQWYHRRCFPSHSYCGTHTQLSGSCGSNHQSLLASHEPRIWFTQTRHRTQEQRRALQDRLAGELTLCTNRGVGLLRMRQRAQLRLHLLLHHLPLGCRSRFPFKGSFP